MTNLEDTTKILQGKEGSKVLFKHKSVDNFERGVFAGFSNIPSWTKGWTILIRRESKKDLIIKEMVVEPEYIKSENNYFKIEYLAHYAGESNIRPNDKNYTKHNELLKAQGY
jgi:hypothetical protein